MGYSDVMSILRHNQCNRHKLGLSCCLTLCFLLLCVYDVPWWQTLVLTPYQSIPCPPLYLSLFSPPPPFFAIVFQYLVWIFLRCSCDSEAWLSKCTETGLPDSCVYPAPELCLAAGHEIPELCFTRPRQCWLSMRVFVFLHLSQGCCLQTQQLGFSHYLMNSQVNSRSESSFNSQRPSAASSSLAGDTLRWLCVLVGLNVMQWWSHCCFCSVRL